MRTTRVLCTMVVAAAAGCSPPPPAPHDHAGHTTAPLACAADLEHHAGTTTGGALALANLDAQIEGRAAYVARLPGDLSGRKALVDLLLSRARFSGTYQDFDEAYVHAHAAVAEHPDAAAAHLLLAEVHSATHRFDDALASLDRAGALGADTTEARDVVRVARGLELEEVLERRSAAVAELPSYARFTALAAVQAALGRYDDADASYLAALDAYRDVSPFPVAWVAFRRGVMWSEQANRPDRGCALYQEALGYLPSYVVANVHQAELERDAHPARAIDRLHRALEVTGDPEPAGLLGELLLGSQPDDAAVHIEAARARYDELLARHRLAFADHGAEFFMGPGADPARALELALDNLDNRATERAYDIAIRAASNAGRQQLACELSAEAPEPRASEPLRELLAAMDKACP